MSFILCNFHPHPRPGPLFSISIEKPTEEYFGWYEVRRDSVLVDDGDLEFGDIRLGYFEIGLVVDHVCDGDALDPDEAEALLEQVAEEIGNSM